MMYVNATNEMMKSGEALVGMKRRGSQLQYGSSQLAFSIPCFVAGCLHLLPSKTEHDDDDDDDGVCGCWPFGGKVQIDRQERRLT